MYKIEKHVPMPDSELAHAKFPFAQLQVGDSFFVPGRKASEISNAAQWHKRKLGWNFRCVTVDGGARVWRVS